MKFQNNLAAQKFFSDAVLQHTIGKGGPWYHLSQEKVIGILREGEVIFAESEQGTTLFAEWKKPAVGAMGGRVGYFHVQFALVCRKEKGGVLEIVSFFEKNFDKM